MGTVRHTRRNWAKFGLISSASTQTKTTMTGLGTRLAENDEKVTGSGTGMRTEVVQSWSGNETTAIS